MFKNSHGTEGVEIVADPDRFEDVSKLLQVYDGINQDRVWAFHCTGQIGKMNTKLFFEEKNFLQKGRLIYGSCGSHHVAF